VPKAQQARRDLKDLKDLKDLRVLEARLVKLAPLVPPAARRLLSVKVHKRWDSHRQRACPASGLRAVEA